jgi:hypothetical protein
MALKIVPKFNDDYGRANPLPFQFGHKQSNSNQMRPNPRPLIPSYLFEEKRNIFPWEKRTSTVIFLIFSVNIHTELWPLIQFFFIQLNFQPIIGSKARKAMTSRQHSSFSIDNLLSLSAASAAAASTSTAMPPPFCWPPPPPFPLPPMFSLPPPAMFAACWPGPGCWPPPPPPSTASLPMPLWSALLAQPSLAAIQSPTSPTTVAEVGSKKCKVNKVEKLKIQQSITDQQGNKVEKIENTVINHSLISTSHL